MPQLFRRLQNLRYNIITFITKTSIHQIHTLHGPGVRQKFYLKISFQPYVTLEGLSWYYLHFVDGVRVGRHKRLKLALECRTSKRKMQDRPIGICALQPLRIANKTLKECSSEGCFKFVLKGRLRNNGIKFCHLQCLHEYIKSMVCGG
jgi:hypothetical protein